MLSLSSLIAFLLDLLRDDEIRAEFDADPTAVLARHGLQGVTAEDIRDASPLLADHVAVRSRGDGDHCGDDEPAHHHDRDDNGSRHHYDRDDNTSRHHYDRDDDPVEEIHNVTNNYRIDKDVVVNNNTTVHNTYNEYNIDDRDTIVIGDDNTVVQDSFNQDNDGVDNKGGTIEDSVVAGDDIEGSFNSDDDTLVNDSFNEDNDRTTVDDSYNQDNDTTAVTVSDDDTTLTASDNDTTTAVANSYNADNDGADLDVDATPADSAA